MHFTFITFHLRPPPPPPSRADPRALAFFFALDGKPRACQKLENGPGVGKCPAPGQYKICKCPTPGTDKAGKCPAVARGGEGGAVLGAGGID